MTSRLLCVTAALLAGCGPSSRFSGEPLPEPPRFAEGDASCPVVSTMREVEGAALVIVHEQTESDAFLGRLNFDGNAWHKIDQTTHAAFHLGAVSVSVSPQGDVFAGLLDQTGPLAAPQLRRTADNGWLSVPYEFELSSSRRTLPRALSLDADRAAVTFFETGGVLPPRQGTFLWEEGGWVTLEPMGPATGRSYHRGPGTELWRVRPPDGLGHIYFDAWSGTDFRPLAVGLEVSRPGFVRALRPVGDAVMVLFDTSDNFGAGFELFEISAYGAALVATAPTADMRIFDLSFDLQLRPVISLSGFTSDRALLRSYRLEEGAWREVFSAELAHFLEGSAAASVVGDQLLVGWTETEQTIEFLREHHTDCRVVLTRTRL